MAYPPGPLFGARTLNAPPVVHAAAHYKCHSPWPTRSLLPCCTARQSGVAAPQGKAGQGLRLSVLACLQPPPSTSFPVGLMLGSTTRRTSLPQGSQIGLNRPTAIGAALASLASPAPIGRTRTDELLLRRALKINPPRTPAAATASLLPAAGLHKRTRSPLAESASPRRSPRRSPKPSPERCLRRDLTASSQDLANPSAPPKRKRVEADFDMLFTANAGRGAPPAEDQADSEARSPVAAAASADADADDGCSDGALSDVEIVGHSLADERAGGCSARAGAPASPGEQPWRCHACTLENAATFLSCAACNMQRHAPAARGCTATIASGPRPHTVAPAPSKAKPAVMAQGVGKARGGGVPAKAKGKKGLQGTPCHPFDSCGPKPLPPTARAYENAPRGAPPVLTPVRVAVCAICVWRAAGKSTVVPKKNQPGSGIERYLRREPQSTDR